MSAISRSILVFILGLISTAAVLAKEEAFLLHNHLGYDLRFAKHAVIRGDAAQRFSEFMVKAFPEGIVVLRGKVKACGPVFKWRDWNFWTIDFDDLASEGTFVIECPAESHTLRSFPFRVERDLLERYTLSDVLFYFKGQRSSGLLDKADRRMTFSASREGIIDAHGGWYDATGDYGKHLSHLSFSNFLNPQQIPLVVWSLFKTNEILAASGNAHFTQFRRRILDEAMYGADYLVRVKNPDGSFYQSISAPGPGKKPEDRRITPMAGAFRVKEKKPTDKESREPYPEAAEEDIYEVGFRSGGGMAIAALAMAARLPEGGDFPPAAFLQAAEASFAFLQQHNLAFAADGKENIIDDYCALIAATELFRSTGKEEYRRAAAQRAEHLMSRLVVQAPGRGYWRADDSDRPFFHPSDAGLPVISLLEFAGIADAPMKAKITTAVKRSLQFEMDITRSVANPFGLARQYVQDANGHRKFSFFFPHDTEAAPWWQGENARLASIAAAARLALPLFAEDKKFCSLLSDHSVSQLNWILGLNPFDVCMLQGTGRNNPEYLFFGSYQYRNAPGGICNGITSGLQDEEGIEFNLPYAVTGKDNDWRWGEQWLPHAAWFLLAVAAGAGL